MERHLSRSEAETIKIAGLLGAKIRLPAMICLYGDLGTGKTLFTKGLAGVMGIPAGKVKSPTFTFQRRYTSGKKKFYHFDFYRIREADDLIRRDLEEALADRHGLVVAEWAENVKDALPGKRVDIECKYIGENSREYIIRFIDHD
jgi:tRNA threonylcarbamoyladenosine biosynthesis protein TsaE